MGSHLDKELSPPAHTPDREDNLCCFQDILNLNENQVRIEEQREECVHDYVPTSKVPATVGENREVPLCLLCSAGAFFTIQPLTCLRSQMPRAYKMLYFFVFSEVLLFLSLAEQLLCAPLVRFGGEGCFNTPLDQPFRG